MDIRSKCIHCSSGLKDAYGAVSFPIYQSATFSHPGVGESTGYDYSRMQNPTREQLEKTVAALEGGIDALAFSSGMAAIDAVMELFAPGCRIIVSDDIYGGTHRLFEHIGKKNGLQFDYVNTSDLSRIKNAILPSTRALFIETPTNPMMQVSDIAAVSALGRENGLLTIVDNTFLTPYFQRPLALGADIALHSGTKFLGGHNDTIAGFLVVKGRELSEKLRFIFKTTGACLSSMDSWLILRGIKTLAVRLEKQQENAFAVANWLLEHPRVAKVHYIGLPAHPSYSLSKKQATGFGSMISFETDSEETAVQILKRVRLIQYAESLGGVESLITYPMLQTHADIPEEIREEKGITKKLLRLSVGLEYAGDLTNDLRQALKD
jgi:cystathionine gamma-synthase